MHECKTASYKKVRFFLLATLVVVLSTTISAGLVSAASYQNAYMIMFDGSACDNVAYAQSMGYDYVGYQNGMENCPGELNLKFYMESPDHKIPVSAGYIYPDGYYTQAEKALYNDILLWKSTASFPDNLATGWFRADGSFKPLLDFQQQAVIDYQIQRTLDNIERAENPNKNFLFGGFSWDVPSLEGDLWSGPQNLPLQGQTGTGRQVDISYWTGSCSGVKHPGLPQDYQCYSDGRAAFMKQLVTQTERVYGDIKTVIEPYYPWNGYMEEIASRYDAHQLKPDLLLQEGDTTAFVTDDRIFDSGLLTKSQVASSTTKDYYHHENLVIAGNAAVNGAWYLWFGRIGGSGNWVREDSIKDVPDRLKLIRAMPGWDNLNNVPLSTRSWDSQNLEYESSLSLANEDIIVSVHPKNKNTYAVILDTSAGIDMNGRSVESIYTVDDLFRPNYEASSHFSQSNGKLYLRSSSNEGRGYIITFREALPPQPEPEPEPQPNQGPYCSDSDEGIVTSVSGAISGLYADNKPYTLTDTCIDEDRVEEYYCLNGLYHQRTTQICAHGCDNGACQSAPAPEPQPEPNQGPVCFDTDLLDTNNKGEITGLYADDKPYTLVDTCASSTTVREYYCLDNTYHQVMTETCTYGCDNGACLEEPPQEPEPEPELAPVCSDSDSGTDYTHRGSISGLYADYKPYTLVDTCSDGNTLTEYYCLDEKWHKRTTQTCAYGCEDGACRLLPDVDSSQAPICADSDNGNNDNVAGYITGLYADGKEYTLNDVCINSDTLQEQYCLDDTYHQRATVNCPNGCSAGACI